MDTLPSEGKPYAGITKGMKETGWKIVWQDKCFWVFEGGYLYYLYDGETVGSMEYFVEAPKLCDYINRPPTLPYNRYLVKTLKEFSVIPNRCGAIIIIYTIYTKV